MAWDDQAKRVVIKAIGTVESNLKYDAINYNDPITVGFMQWYGTRAARILNRIRTENPASWVGVVASLDNDLTTQPQDSTWWTSRYLSTTEGNSIRPVLYANKQIQFAQALDDFETYKNTWVRQGGNADTQTQAMLFWMVMWHQSPQRALDVLRAAGGTNASARRLFEMSQQNVRLRQYRSRYQQALDIILANDGSGIDLTTGEGGAPAGDDTDADGASDPAPQDGHLQAPDGTLLSDYSHIMFRGNSLHLVKHGGGVVICPPLRNKEWLIPGGRVGPGKGTPVTTNPPNPSPDPDGETIPPGNHPGERAVAWMLAHQEKWRYSQGVNRLDPFKSGYTDCSGATRLAYLHAMGKDIGTYTQPQSKYGREITRDREKIRQGIGLLPGDLIFYRSSSVRARATHDWDHVEVYIGNAAKETIGQVGSTAPGPSIHPMNRYLNWGDLRVMARRPWA